MWQTEAIERALFAATRLEEAEAHVENKDLRGGIIWIAGGSRDSRLSVGLAENFATKDETAFVPELSWPHRETLTTRCPARFFLKASAANVE